MKTIKEGPVSSGSLAIQDLLPTLARHLMWLDPAKCHEALVVPVPTYALKDRADDWWFSHMAIDQLDDVVDALASLAPAGMEFRMSPLAGKTCGYFATPAGGDK